MCGLSGDASVAVLVCDQCHCCLVGWWPCVSCQLPHCCVIVGDLCSLLGGCRTITVVPILHRQQCQIFPSLPPPFFAIAAINQPCSPHAWTASTQYQGKEMPCHYQGMSVAVFDICCHKVGVLKILGVKNLPSQASPCCLVASRRFGFLYQLS